MIHPIIELIMIIITGITIIHACVNEQALIRQFLANFH